MNGAARWVARYGVGLALAALVLIGALAVPGFFTRDNLTIVLLHVSINAILALGMTFVIVTAGIDLSVGSVLALAGVLTAATITSAPVLDAVGVGGATVAAIAVGIGLGTAAGILNGAVTALMHKLGE